MTRFLRCLLLFSGLLTGLRSATAADWPTWRGDMARTGCSSDQLPASLALSWTRELPAPEPAWIDASNAKVAFDRAPEPVAAGHLLFVPSAVSDSLTAYDTATGRERWRFFADGPVRFAPTVAEGRVYMVSDDGCLYCLEAESGAVLWTHRGGPGSRLVLGNGRLISMWPARGGPAVAGGTVYFTAGIWPFMGIFVQALDAKTGASQWCNSGTGATWTVQQHNSPAFAGVAPQGYLAVAGDTLLVPGGRTVPAAFSRRSGNLLYFDPSSRSFGKDSGGYGVSVMGDCFLNGDVVYRLEDGKNLLAEEELQRSGVQQRLACRSVVTPQRLYYAARGKLVAKALPPVQQEKKDRRGHSQQVWVLETAAEADVEPGIEDVFIKAGTRIYGAAPGPAVVAIDTPIEKAGRTVWQAALDDKPWTMLAADGRLFVVTESARLYCFAETSDPPVTHKLEAAAVPSLAAAPLPGIPKAAFEGRGGYCLCFGIPEPGLLESLVADSAMHVLVISPDAEAVHQLRTRAVVAGSYGRRVAAVVTDPLAVALPRYCASLVVITEAAAAAGVDAKQDRLSEQLAAVLRPYDGWAVMPESVALGALGPGFTREQAGGLVCLRRSGPLPGAGSWTQQYADAANGGISADAVVRAPLGLLWFGGSANDLILPRHGHGPNPQVVGGRLFIEGPDILRALDVYTGRLLWQTKLPGIGRFYDVTGHQPGANAIGSNYASTVDSVYVMRPDACLRLAADSGTQLAAWQPPGTAGGTGRWGSLRVWQDLLVGTTSTVNVKVEEIAIPKAASAVFTSPTFEAKKRQPAATVDVPVRPGQWLYLAATTRGRGTGADWADWLDPRFEGEGGTRSLADMDWVYARNAGGEVQRGRNAAGKPLRVAGKTSRHGLGTRAESLVVFEAPPGTKRFRASVGLDDEAGRQPRKANVKAMVFVMNAPDVPAVTSIARVPGVSMGDDYAPASKRLVVLDRQTGDLLWQREAVYNFRHNAVAVAAGKVFCVDGITERKYEYLRRRGFRPSEPVALYALEARSGKVLWQTRDQVFGTYLAYSKAHDLLVEAGSAARDRAADEVRQGLTAYRGEDGSVLWRRPEIDYNGPVLLWRDWLITNGTGGFALDLRTGKPAVVSDPLTGSEVPWRYVRQYGCNTAIGSTHLLTFRSAAAGFVDLDAAMGTGNFGGFKSGCTSNLIAADGVLSAPDYTRTCTCSYQLQASLALVPMPDVEMWSFSWLSWNGKTPIRRLGLNFGAPGDRLAPDGTYWLDTPSLGGPSPAVPVELKGRDIQPFRHHASLFTGDRYPWVAASGLTGLRTVNVPLGDGSERTFTVRLYFAEPDTTVRPGDRRFSVSLQGRPVWEDVDVRREAGASRRVLVKQANNIVVGKRLQVALAPQAGETILCGLELFADEP